jgi:regulator of sirC expression with transglutaminase-like and TPR domain
LFDGGRLRANERDFHAPENSDLAWVLAQGRSNPLGLSLVFILTARRLGLEVEGCAFPARFLCRVRDGRRTWVIDCYDRGRRHDLNVLLGRDGLSEPMRRALVAAAPPGAVLVRLLRNLHDALTRAGRAEDAAMAERLLASLHVGP